MINQIYSGNNPWREKVVSSALAYANHIWKPTNENNFHGYDTDGIFINTPDSSYVSAKYNCGWWIIDQYNKGIPYNWDGSATIEEFTTGITTGKFVRNVPDSRDNGVSKYCVGVDCSGLITICWGVAKRLYTKTITEIASSLDSMDSLLPGSHVMIFINFIDDEKTYAQIVDASRSTGIVFVANGRSIVKSANTPDIIIASVIQGLNITISKPNTRLIIDNVPKRG